MLHRTAPYNRMKHVLLVPRVVVDATILYANFQLNILFIYILYIHIIARATFVTIQRKKISIPVRSRSDAWNIDHKKYI